MDTIFAVSSGQPPAAIAIVRVSGPDALAATERLAGVLPSPREARVRVLRGIDNVVLDRALVLVFPGPATATGEDLVELHCHGGRAVVDGVESALAAQPRLRRAAPGEFTRRALTHGRIDLAEAEGLADLLAAQTERQRRAALDAAEGRVSQEIHAWLGRITMLSARVEAALDFADEDDVAACGDEATHIREEMKILADDIGQVLAHPPVERLRDGIRVVIAGPPNAGKSTLINLLGQCDVAIVSPIAGTTRDPIETRVMRNGLIYLLTDTAGLTETDDKIEQIGVSRAESAIRSADIVLWLGDDRPIGPAIAVHSRADLPGRETMPADRDIAISHEDVRSIESLWRLIEQRANTLVPNIDTLAMNRAHHASCKRATSALLTTTNDMLIVAEHLRQSANALAHVLGINAPEAMLDALFSRFCVGK